MDFLIKNDMNSKWYPMVAILLGTGMRVGEVTGLRWCDVDFEDNYIDINHTLVYYAAGKGRSEYAINDTKTPASKRKIPMTNMVRDAFLQEKMYQEAIGVSCNVEIDGYRNFVFVNRFGGVYNQCTINRVLKRIIRDCNDAEFLKSEHPKVLLPNFSAHTFRHTFATNLVSAGVPPRMAMDLLGHSTIETTMDIYSHVTEEMRGDFLKKYEHFFSLNDDENMNFESLR